MIIPLLAIELKVTPYGNRTNNLYFGGGNLALSMLCNETPPVSLLFFQSTGILCASNPKLAIFARNAYFFKIFEICLIIVIFDRSPNKNFALRLKMFILNFA